MLSKSNDVPNSRSTCCITFSKCGKFLAVPTEKKVVVLGRDETWEQVKEVKIAGLEAGEIVTTTDWDSGGNHILAGTNKGNLCLVSFPSMALVNIIQTGKKYNICGLVWHPAENEVGNKKS